LTGSETLTTAEQVRIIGEEIGRPLRFEEAPAEETRRAWISDGLPPEVVDGILEAHAEFVAKPEPLTRTVEEVTGTPARPFREWASDHTGDFR
ncbi:MAG: nucleoside-diphosphate sugar epimerase, partial [Rubrobacteraceae bacterium]